MKLRKFSAGYFALPIAAILLACPSFGDTKKPAAPAKPAAKAAAPKAGGAAAGASKGPSTASHGPTTTGSHGPTTNGSHGPTTTGSHGPSTSSPHGPSTSVHGPTPSHGPAGPHGPEGRGSLAAGHGGGTAGARGHSVAETRNGRVERRADGRVAGFHDNRRGMDVHHGLNGNRRVMVERRDHSRVYAERGGRGYVQRPYNYHGHEYARRSYYYHGHYYHAYYGRYYYHGVYVNPYYSPYYYRPAFYGWAYNPWVAPVPYAWGWGGAPWYGYYGAYFTPFPVYPSASFWLTDYLISSSLEAAYAANQAAQAQAAAQAQGGAAPAPLSPEVKQEIADEVKNQIAIENTEAKSVGNGAVSEPDPASSSIQRLIDTPPHVFVAGQDLDVVDSAQGECALSQGDAIQLTVRVPADATAATVTVIASKGGKECPNGDVISVELTDLQEMQNHMRQTIDQGMQELQKKGGQGGLPVVPVSAQAAPTESPMVAAAPPPPSQSEVASEINQQSQEADAAEKEMGSEAPASGSGDSTSAAPPAAPAAPAAPANIGIGQSIEDVTGALGQPSKIVNLGAKKIYIYPDMKITFLNGKVSNVE